MEWGGVGWSGVEWGGVGWSWGVDDYYYEVKDLLFGFYHLKSSD